MDSGPCDMPGCPTNAWGLYHLEGGCVALRGVELQALCPQHVVSATPLGEMVQVAGPMLGDPLQPRTAARA